MNKPILLEIIACIVLGTILGIAFWLCDGGKTCKKAPECPGKVSKVLEIASENKVVEVYQGKWKKEGYLEVIK